MSYRALVLIAAITAAAPLAAQDAAVTVAGAAVSDGRAITMPPRFALRTAATPASPPCVTSLRPGFTLVGDELLPL